MKKLLMTASSWGHIRHFHLPYLRAFRTLGWEVHLGCANVPTQIAEADVTIDLPFTKEMTAPQNFKVSHRLRQKMREECYDLVICHTSLAAFFTRLGAIGLDKRPRIINMVHGYLFDDDTPPVKKAIYLGAERLTAPVTDLVLTMNRWDEDYAKRHRLGREVVNVPGIGVDFTPFQISGQRAMLRNQLNIPEEGVVLIYPAEFSRRKNQQMLIRAMGCLPQNVYLILPGTGALLEDCSALAERMGVMSRVRFPGYVEDVAQWYEASDVAVSASRSEGLPFNVMEAMACGLPVVASDVKGHQDLVVPGETGLLYPFDDDGAFVEAVSQLMADSKLFRHSGERSRAAVECYGLPQVLDVVMAAYGVPQQVPATR